MYRSSPIGLGVVSADYKLLRINDRLAEINGVAPGEHIGSTLREVVPDLADTAEPLIRKVVETGEPILNLKINGETRAQPGVWRKWIELWLPARDGRGR